MAIDFFTSAIGLTCFTGCIYFVGVEYRAYIYFSIENHHF